MAVALLWLGLLLGLRHALEVDHVAAVASLASGTGRSRQVAFVAVAWGAGHSAVLLLAGAATAYLGVRWPPSVQRLCEAVGGMVLVWLGADVLRRAKLAPLATRGAARPAATRALAIGGLHGLEGSGAAVLLVMPAVRSPSQAVAYLAAFGVGSIAGMLLCSLAVTAPLGVLAQRLRWRARPLQLGIGASSVVIGAVIYMRSIFT